jgi:hypothetical protein
MGRSLPFPVPLSLYEMDEIRNCAFTLMMVITHDRDRLMVEKVFRNYMK